MQNLSNHYINAKIHRKHNINKGGICEMLFNKKKQTESGFTIVELLIVIVIIGILAALVLNTFTGAQKKARDSKRDTDIKAISTQLEACYNDDATTVTASGSCGTTAPGGLYPVAVNSTSLKSLDPKALVDPSGSVTLSNASAAVLIAACSNTGAVSTIVTSVGGVALASLGQNYYYVPLTLPGGPCATGQTYAGTLTTTAPASYFVLYKKEAGSNAGWNIRVGLN